jgi:hypothetical protein
MGAGKENATKTRFEQLNEKIKELQDSLGSFIPDSRALLRTISQNNSNKELINRAKRWTVNRKRGLSLTRDRLKFHHDSLKQTLFNKEGLNDFEVYMGRTAPAPLTVEERQTIAQEIQEMKITITNITMQMRTCLNDSKHASTHIRRIKTENRDTNIVLKRETAIHQPNVRLIRKLTRERDRFSQNTAKMTLICFAKSVKFSEKKTDKEAKMKAKSFDLKLFLNIPCEIMKLIGKFVPYEVRTDLLNINFVRRNLKLDYKRFMSHVSTLDEVKLLLTENPYIYNTKSTIYNDKMKICCIMNVIKSQNAELAYELTLSQTRFTKLPSIN